MDVDGWKNHINVKNTHLVLRVLIPSATRILGDKVLVGNRAKTIVCNDSVVVIN